MDGYRDDLEPTSKVGKIIGRIFLFISLVVYAVIFYRIFISSDTSTAKDIVLDKSGEHARLESFLQLSLPGEDGPVSKLFQNADEGHPPYFVVYSIDPITTMDEEGRIQMRNAVYLETAKSLQFALKVNTKYHDVDEVGKLKYDVYLNVERKGGVITRHDVSFTTTTSRSNYATTKYGFNDVNFNIKEDSVYLVIEDEGKTVLKLLLTDETIHSQKENPYKIDYEKL